MSWLNRIPLAAIAALVLIAAPANAQDYITEDVAFFERVTVGEIEVTPFGIVRDRRCADIRFCTRENTLIVSVLLHNYRGENEFVLRLGEPTEVPGGFLILHGAGTRPSLRGAIQLSEYALTLEFVPLILDYGR